MKLTLTKAGFALPTVMIASVTMLMVLLVALTTTTSVSTSIDAQYYDHLSQEATESGLAMAKACIIGQGSANWSNTSPLHPNTNCGGGAPCTGNDQCYVLNEPNVTTSFSVGTPQLDANGSYKIPVTGNAQQLRTSNGAVWQTHSDTKIMRLRVGWKQISAGRAFTCGISFNDLAYCWGYNGYGQLGNGTTSSSTQPVAVARSGVLSGKTFKSIMTGYYQTCAIASDDKAYCWGYNNFGQLGNGSTTSSPLPVAVSTTGTLSGKTIKQLTTGYAQTCAIASDSKAYCWGLNNLGQLGSGSASNSSVPVAVSSSGAMGSQTVKQIATGYAQTCAIAVNQRAYCWGYNNVGQLGNGNAISSAVPVAVSTAGVLNGKSIQQISTGMYTECAVTTDGVAACWGYNNVGQLGNGNTTSSTLPVAVSTTGVLSGKTAKQISSSMPENYFFSCLVASDNNSYCWGSNDYGQLGNGSTTASSLPVKVDTNGALSSVSLDDIETGYGSAYALSSTTGRMYSWGYNANGTYGNGTAIESHVPALGGTVDATILY